jgi:hypothetical protein
MTMLEMDKKSLALPGNGIDSRRRIVGKSTIPNEIVTNYQKVRFVLIVVELRTLTIVNVVDASFELMTAAEIVDTYEERFASRHRGQKVCLGMDCLTYLLI